MGVSDFFGFLFFLFEAVEGVVGLTNTNLIDSNVGSCESPIPQVVVLVASLHLQPAEDITRIVDIGFLGKELGFIVQSLVRHSN